MRPDVRKRNSSFDEQQSCRERPEHNVPPRRFLPRRLVCVAHERRAPPDRLPPVRRTPRRARQSSAKFRAAHKRRGAHVVWRRGVAVVVVAVVAVAVVAVQRRRRRRVFAYSRASRPIVNGRHAVSHRSRRPRIRRLRRSVFLFLRQSFPRSTGPPG